MERWKAEGEEGDRGWDGWMASLMQWAWTWANSGRWWGTGKPSMLQSVGLQRVGHDLVTEQQQQQAVVSLDNGIYYSGLKRNEPSSSWRNPEESSMHIAKWNKPIWKGYILYDSNSMTFWKRYKYGDGHMIIGCQVWGMGMRGKDEYAKDWGSLGQWNYSMIL